MPPLVISFAILLWTSAIIATDSIAFLIRRFSLVRLACVGNILLNSFTGGSDSRKVITKFYHDRDSDSYINCIGSSDSKGKSYSSGVRAIYTCICTQKDWE
jgi:hypothetical protein